MKANETTPSATAPIFTSADVKEQIRAFVSMLEMKTGNGARCSNQEYAEVLFMTAAKLGVLAPAMLPQAMQLWDAFPKSPSAFRLMLEKATDAADPVADAKILDRYAAMMNAAK